MNPYRTADPGPYCLLYRLSKNIPKQDIKANWSWERKSISSEAILKNIFTHNFPGV